MAKLVSEKPRVNIIFAAAQANMGWRFAQLLWRAGSGLSAGQDRGLSSAAMSNV